MTVLRMCELGQISRAGLYRFEPEVERREEDLDLRDAIQRIALEFPCYGRPRITAELRRQGWAVNHKRVGRIMREDNLLCIRRRKFVCTTDSNHSFRVYPNWAGKMELDRRRPVVGRRHHLHPAGDRIRLPGGGVGRILPPGDWLGAGPHSGGRLGDRGAANGFPAARPASQG